jgi:hypothetical protein
MRLPDRPWRQTKAEKKPDLSYFCEKDCVGKTVSKTNTRNTNDRIHLCTLSIWGAVGGTHYNSSRLAERKGVKKVVSVHPRNFEVRMTNKRFSSFILVLKQEKKFILLFNRSEKFIF